MFNRKVAYQWYLGTAFWRAKSDEAIARANGICQICHKRRATQTHHLTYERVFNELATDLQPVCSACHHAIHQRKAANDNEPQLPFPIAENE